MRHSDDARIHEIPEQLVSSYGWREMMRIVAGRTLGPALQDSVWEWSELAFDRHVSKQSLTGVTAVHGYEYASLATFQRARQQGLRIIYDMLVPGWIQSQQILAAEYAKFPELCSPEWKRVHSKTDRRNRRKQREIELADFVVTNSEFSRKSLIEQGAPLDRLLLVPYGMPPPVESHLQPAGQRFRFLYAGTLSVRKGVHYLLDAWRKAAPSASQAELSLVGALDLPGELLDNLAGHVSFHQSVPREELYRLYRESSLLLFPTLCDGFGQVLTEALSQGLPVLTTARAGAADFIEAGVNGFIVPAASADALEERISWCIKNPEAVRKMEPAALKSAAQWQWSDYRGRLATEIRSRLLGTRRRAVSQPPGPLIES